MTYKIIKLLQKEEKEKGKINIPEGDWVEHYEELWYDSKENKNQRRR
jgi:hypothetical protein